ncbi:MAG TPA: hypothetical protein VMM60_07405 [Ilumatobacter sp.]|nr:hypothetical protein [Ilumatobacter sp.]
MVANITCETRLADADLAHHRDEPATTDRAVVETPHQLRPLAVAPDDRRTDDLGHRISIAQTRSVGRWERSIELAVDGGRSRTLHTEVSELARFHRQR